MNEAVFVVDMVKDFMPKSVYEDAKLPVEPAEKIIDPTKKLIEYYGAKEL